MSDFITYREPDNDGNLCYYILQRDFPHYMGVISTRPRKYLVEAHPISGYYMWIVFDGTLRGKQVPSYTNVIDEINESISKMAIWYLQTVILPKKEKYKKYKINDTVTGK